MLIMDESYLPAFAAAGTDLDPAVRREVARTAGERWVWSADEQSSAAIALMLNLAEDEDREVKYNAVYFGLSTIREKDPGIIRFLLELAIDDREPNFYRRVKWALEPQREDTKKVLQQLIYEPGGKKAAGAREIYRDMVGEEFTDVGNAAE